MTKTSKIYSTIILIALFLLGCKSTDNKTQALCEAYNDEFQITDSSTIKINAINVTKINFVDRIEQESGDGTKFKRNNTYTLFQSNNHKVLDSLFFIYDTCPREICLKTGNFLILLELDHDNSRWTISKNYEIIRDIFPKDTPDKIYFCDPILQAAYH